MLSCWGIYLHPNLGVDRHPNTCPNLCIFTHKYPAKAHTHELTQSPFPSRADPSWRKQCDLWNHFISDWMRRTKHPVWLRNGFTVMLCREWEPRRDVPATNSNVEGDLKTNPWPPTGHNMLLSVGRLDRKLIIHAETSIWISQYVAQQKMSHLVCRNTKHSLLKCDN